ncbi:MAG: hypothetical protein CMI06_04215 [Oceanospirillaceae bacterium]|nr:hypothetical protein [Oceanospirillaceae bacterium]
MERISPFHGDFFAGALYHFYPTNASTKQPDDGLRHVIRNAPAAAEHHKRQAQFLIKANYEDHWFNTAATTSTMAA